MKPVRTVHVSLDGKLYEIHDVTTVSELRERLQEVSGMNNRTLGGDSQISYRGKALKTTDILSRVGVKEGATLAVTFQSSNDTEDDNPRSSSSAKKKKSSKNRKSNHKSKSNRRKRNNKHDGWGASFSSSPFTGNHSRFGANDSGPSSPNTPPSLFEWMKEENLDWNDVIESLKSITRDDVSLIVRETLTRSYNQLRDFWNDPNIRGIFNDPVKIEGARQMCLSNPELRTSIEGVPGGKKLLNDQEAWNTYFQTLGKVTKSAGDTVLDGILDVLIDILKSGSSNVSGPRSTTSMPDLSRSSTVGTCEPSFQSETIDPSVASNVLFELSESEEEDF